jgi:hypothetical protein
MKNILPEPDYYLLKAATMKNIVPAKETEGSIDQTPLKR